MKITFEIKCPRGLILEIGKRGRALASPLWVLEDTTGFTRDEVLTCLRRMAGKLFPGAEVEERWATLSTATLLKVLDAIGNDGHTIHTPEALLNVGVPESIVNQHVKTYASDFSDPKTTITDNAGNVVKEMDGVYGLAVLWAIQIELGANASSKMGRGTVARELTANIRAKLAAMS